jgi:hypothetical protein
MPKMRLAAQIGFILSAVWLATLCVAKENTITFESVVLGFDSSDGPLPSWPKRMIRYTSAGELSPNVDSALDQAIAQISRFTGLQFERSNAADIVFIFDARAIIDAHEYPDRLRFLGMDEAEIRALQKSIGKPDSPGGQSCGGIAFVKSDNDISFSLGLAQDVSEKCILLLVFPVVGVRFMGSADEALGLKMACLLYRGRGLGVRTISAFYEKKKELEAECLTSP